MRDTEQTRRIKQVIPWWDLRHRGARSDLLRRAFQGEDVDAYRAVGGMRNAWVDGKRIPLNECGRWGGDDGSAA
jgi:hypothetical protein